MGVSDSADGGSAGISLLFAYGASKNETDDNPRANITRKILK
jgi:hypothetical protein